MDERNDRRDLYEEFESEVVKRGNTEAFSTKQTLWKSLTTHLTMTIIS